MGPLPETHAKAGTTGTSLPAARLLIAALVAALSIGCLLRPPGEHGLLHEVTLVHDDLVRSYFVHLPEHDGPLAGSPLVLALHGGGRADGDELAARFGFDAIADREGFVVAYPNGVDAQWSDGRGITARGGSELSDVDDVGFLLAVIDQLLDEYKLDPDRVFVTGVSNGGMMTQRLAVEGGGQLAAIATVISNLPVALAQRDPRSELSVLLMNGTEDPFMPWDGGPVTVLGKELGEVLSTRGSVDYWLEHNGLEGESPAPPAP